MSDPTQSDKPVAKAKGKAQASAKTTPKAKARRKRRKPGLSKAEAAELFARLAADRPDPKTELRYTNPFTLLIAVALSAQATDVGVNRATKRLFEIAPDPQSMAALSEEDIREHIKTIGLFRNKAKNARALALKLIEDFGGETPRTREELMTLPGVGRKTANVVLNEAFGQPTIAVDTHIFRVSNRTGLAPGDTPDEVEARLEEVTPDEYKKGAHHWLILHGRYVCLARTPKCHECVIRDLCRFKEKTPDPGSEEARVDKMARRQAAAQAKVKSKGKAKANTKSGAAQARRRARSAQ